MASPLENVSSTVLKSHLPPGIVDNLERFRERAMAKGTTRR